MLVDQQTASGEITDLEGGSDIEKIYNPPLPCDFTSLDGCVDVDVDLACSGANVHPSAVLLAIMMFHQVWLTI